MVSAPATPVESNAPRRRSPGGWAFTWGAVLLLVAGLVTYLILSAATADFQTVDEKRALERAKILADRLSDDQKLLHDKPSWLNKGKGLVRVPIDRAISMTLAELSQVQPHPAYPISQSPPQPASALLNYGTQFPGKTTTKATTPTLPTGAQPAGSPAPAPASALPAATPVAASPDAAASIGKSSPAPAPILVAPPTPSVAPAATGAPATTASPAPAIPAATAGPLPAAPAATPAASQPAAAPIGTP